MNDLMKAGRVELVSMADVEKAARLMAASGFFEDTKDLAQAAVKIMAGAELGIGPYAAMTGINIIKGKPVIGAGLLASLIKRSGIYDYLVDELNDERCVITFTRNGYKLGTSVFSLADARKTGAGRADPTKSGQSNLDRYTKNILFARAISNGVKWYCPDVLVGQVYVPEEMEESAINNPVNQVRAEIEAVTSMPEEEADAGEERVQSPTKAERPFSPGVFCFNFNLMVDKLHNNGGVSATADQVAFVQKMLTGIFESELEERMVLKYLTGFESPFLLSNAEVLAFERVLQKADIASVELLWLRDELLEKLGNEYGTTTYPLPGDEPSPVFNKTEDGSNEVME